ncbi:MAG: tRNA 2-thiouridine(34) synthase MnmA [Clostridia bacterium]|nr:tRNA 2-thiouridine(34) synthase MnmA [Clostridia bacterium]
MQKALIAMSGGVDSSVAAYLTKQAGYDCIGVTMRLFDGENIAGDKTCCSEDDVLDAKSVARRLGIPHHTFNFKSDFEKSVIEPFVAEYERGATPNPCIECNRHLKFAALYERAKALGCEYIVTGHYARIVRAGEKYLLCRAKNTEKDQSYVLYSLTQEQLTHTLFPLGEISKEQTRAIAAEQGFISAHKPESQDICFIPDGDYAAFIRRRTGRDYPEGDFVDTAGNVLGRHKGIIEYTVGQRKGLGIALGAPAYVKEIDTANNRVVLCKNEELFTSELNAKDFNWISGDLPTGEVNCMAAVRYRGALKPAIAIPTGEDTVAVRFLSPQRAVTPGQAVVLYDGDTVLGGGTID